MINIHCYVGRTTADLVGTDLFVANERLDGQTIREHFLNGSAMPSAGPVIDLLLDPSRLDSPAWAGEEIGAYELNQALARLRGTSGAAPHENTIGLILARRYRGQGRIFGVMFDLDADILGGGQSYAQIQRQGCAVFLEAIQVEHDGQDAAFREHAFFTAIHELGHVFNLWHIQSPTSFMTPSRELTFPAEAPNTVYQFAPISQEFLARCDFDPHVQPGESSFGERGPGGPSSSDSPFDTRRGPRGLDLHITVEPQEVWRFEPLELDLTLSLQRGRRVLELPREVDPSYDRFCIWITEPSGVRRRYRPALWCCSNGDVIRITPDAPYQRDVTIFRESGGYTFRSPGLHHIEVTLRVGGREIRSNTADVFIRPEPLSDRTCQIIGRVVTERRVVALLQHRSGECDGELLRMLDELRRHHPKTLAAAGIQYALGRTLLRQAIEGYGNPGSVAMLRQAVERLRRVRDHEALSGHRRHLADTLIAEHSTRRASRTRTPTRHGRSQREC